MSLHDKIFWGKSGNRGGKHRARGVWLVDRVNLVSKYTLEQHIRSRCRGSHEVSRVSLENRQPLRTYASGMKKREREKKKKKKIYIIYKWS